MTAADAPDETAREAPGRRSDVVFGAALFVVALVVRLVAAFTLAAEPVWDGHYYDFGARRIASGFGYADEVLRGGIPVWHPWCHYPVGYSSFLAAFYKVFGATAGVAHVANALTGAALALVTFLLAREALSPRRARIAGGLVALHPGLVLYSALVMSEPLSALLTLTSFLVTLRVSRSRNVMTGVVLGALVLGVGALVRPQNLLCAPFLALVAFLPDRQDRRDAATVRPRREAARLGLGLAVVASVMAIVPVLPWTARNCRVMDGCALVSTNAGWNLAIGSFPRATGRFETLRSQDGCAEVTGQVQQDRCWLHYGIDHITRDPIRWIGLMPKKLSHTFDHESFAVEYLHEARPARWPEERRSAMRALLSTTHRALVVAGAIGFVGLAMARSNPRGRIVQALLLGVVLLLVVIGWEAEPPRFWPIVIAICVIPVLPLPGRPPFHPALGMIVSLVATTAFTHAVFFGDDRYHLVATPALCLLAAAALRRSTAASTATRA